MEYIKLKDLCEKEERFVAPNDDAHIDYVDISSVDNKSKSLTKYDTYIFAEAPSRARKRVKHGDVIVSTVRPNLNAVARFNIQTPHTPIASTGFCVLRHKSDVDPIYIYFFCISPNFVRQMVAKATGASYPAVSDTIVREAKLPKHTAEKRVRIVSTLSKAKEIIEHRRAQLAKLDELVKCRFVEMFNGKMQADCNKILGDYAEVTGGFAFKSEKFEAEGVPIIRIGNIINNRVNLDEVVCYPEDFWEENSAYRVNCGDILMAMSGATTGKIGFCNSNSKLLLNQRVARIRTKPLFNYTAFLRAALEQDWMAEHILKTAYGCAQPNISAAEIRQLPMPDTTIESVQCFTSFIHRIDKLRIIGKRGRQKA